MIAALAAVVLAGWLVALGLCTAAAAADRRSS